jgi:hypothetical protein
MLAQGLIAELSCDTAVPLHDQEDQGDSGVILRPAVGEPHEGFALRGVIRFPSPFHRVDSSGVSGCAGHSSARGGRHEHA